MILSRQGGERKGKEGKGAASGLGERIGVIQRAGLCLLVRVRARATLFGLRFFLNPSAQ